jgi:hypothetical protein
MTTVIEKANIAYWFPKLQASGVPVPETVIRQTDADLFKMLDLAADPAVTKFILQLRELARGFNGPVFLRSGHTSAKHSWNDSCCVTNPNSIGSHMREIVEFSAMATPSMPVQTWALREFLQLETAFTAFHGDMPINVERRFFISPMKIYCSHPYWPAEAVEQGGSSDPDWREKLAGMNTIHPMDQARLEFYCFQIMRSNQFEVDDAWSVDFAKDQQGHWWAIDMAPAGRSWHWPDCEHKNRWNY